MPQQTRQCFSENQLSEFLDQTVDGQLEAQIVGHLDSCTVCRDRLEKISGSEAMDSEIKEYLHAPDATTENASEFLPEDQVRDLQKVRDMLGPSENPQMLGRLGGYEVCGVIGRGSAGIVVKALDPRLNRYVAIKLLAPAYSNLGCSRRRFEREGRAIASVKDPHVMPIHAVDEYQGTPYIVMQYMPDGSLQQRIDKHGPLSTSEVVCIGMQIAKGLGAAHDLGIVHRDVKPANVLLANGIANAVVTDFGLARVVDEATMTRSGSISGTPQYMSPEQAKGEKVDQRSDLFSLGSVMHAACTGHPPFKSESVFGVIKKVCEGDAPTIRESNPDIAPWLEAFIERLMSKDPNDRFASAGEANKILALELAHLQNPTMVGQPDRSWWIQRTAQKPVKPKKELVEAGLPVWKILSGVLACAFLATMAMWIATSWDSNEPPAGVAISEFSALPENFGALTPMQVFQVVTQEVRDLEEFSNTMERTVSVAEDGLLKFESNLGTVDVKTHDQPIVKVKLTHSVKAKDKETAEKLFASVRYVDSLAEGMEKGKDACIKLEFPTEALSSEEIEKATELDELKEKLLIRKNSHYRNAKIVLLIPESFNVDLSTKAGSIFLADIDGNVNAVTHGGKVYGGDVNGTVDVSTHGGSIEFNDLDEGGKLMTRGGHIRTFNVNGDLSAETLGGHVKVGSIDGKLKAKTQGGHIEVNEVNETAEVTTLGGHIYLWKAHDAVKVSCDAGEVIVNFVAQPNGESEIKASAGSVKIGYVADCSFDIDARTNVGSVKKPNGETANAIAYTIGDGEHKLVVTNSVGSICFEEVDEDQITSTWEFEYEGDGAKEFNKAYDLHMEGKLVEALELHRKAAEFKKYRGIATYNAGCALALLGKTKAALDTLESSIEFGFDEAEQFHSDSDLDSLRDTKRFQRMLLKLDASGSPVEELKAEGEVRLMKSKEAVAISNLRLVEQQANETQQIKELELKLKKMQKSLEEATLQATQDALKELEVPTAPTPPNSGK